MTAFLKLILSNLPGVIIGISAVLILNYVYLIPAARKDGADAYIAKQAVADVKNEAVAKRTMADLQGKSDYDLCVSSLQRKRMPIDICEQLLGVREEQLESPRDVSPNPSR
jgi:hypothetical protein